VALVLPLGLPVLLPPLRLRLPTPDVPLRLAPLLPSSAALSTRLLLVMALVLELALVLDLLFMRVLLVSVLATCSLRGCHRRCCRGLLGVS
jgi:hypothetical protein